MVLSQALYESESMRIDYYRKSDRQNRQLAFVFSSLGSKILNRNVNGGDYLIENGFDVVNFNTNRNDWFQSVPAAVFEAIAAIDRAGAYEKRVAMGSSMGGYAAIAFSNLLECDIVLAYSPQHDVTIQSDPRFAGYIESIAWSYPISSDTVRPACKFCIVYDRKDLYDSRHAQTIRSVIAPESYSEIILPYAGHAVVFYLLELGLLKHVTVSVLTGRSLQPRDLRKNRRRSRQYLSIAAEHLRQRNHRKLAARLRRIMKSAYKTPALLSWALDGRSDWLSSIAENCERRRLIARRFDAQFYSHLYWDVPCTGLDPILHYIRYGRREQRIIRFRTAA
jgi:hypothetical protein